MKLEVTCSECGTKKLKFIDHRDIMTARWRILGLNLNTSLPIVICDTCEWAPPGRSKPTKSTKSTTSTKPGNQTKSTAIVPVDNAVIEEMENLV